MGLGANSRLLGRVLADSQQLGFDAGGPDWSPEPPSAERLAAHPVLVVGAGIAGIAIGSHLARLGIPYVVVDGSNIATEARSLPSLQQLDEAVRSFLQQHKVDQITVINPRIRNRKIFRQIVDSISKVGLKKPITISRNPSVSLLHASQFNCSRPSP